MPAINDAAGYDKLQALANGGSAGLAAWQGAQAQAQAAKSGALAQVRNATVYGATPGSLGGTLAGITERGAAPGVGQAEAGAAFAPTAASLLGQAKTSALDAARQDLDLELAQKKLDLQQQRDKLDLQRQQMEQSSAEAQGKYDIGMQRSAFELAKATDPQYMSAEERKNMAEGEARAAQAEAFAANQKAQAENRGEQVQSDVASGVDRVNTILRQQAMQRAIDQVSGGHPLSREEHDAANEAATKAGYEGNFIDDLYARQQNVVNAEQNIAAARAGAKLSPEDHAKLEQQFMQPMTDRMQQLKDTLANAAPTQLGAIPITRSTEDRKAALDQLLKQNTDIQLDLPKYEREALGRYGVGPIHQQAWAPDLTPDQRAQKEYEIENRADNQALAEASRNKRILKAEDEAAAKKVADELKMNPKDITDAMTKQNLTADEVKKVFQSDAWKNLNTIAEGYAKDPKKALIINPDDPTSNLYGYKAFQAEANSIADDKLPPGIDPATFRQLVNRYFATSKFGYVPSDLEKVLEQGQNQ